MAYIIRSFIIFLIRSLPVVGFKIGQNIRKAPDFPNFFSSIFSILSTYYYLAVVCQRAAQLQTPYPHLRQEEKGQCNELSFSLIPFVRKLLRRCPYQFIEQELGHMSALDQREARKMRTWFS